MSVLILYGTIEGQTKKISNFVADHLRGLGHQIMMVDTADKAAEISFDGVEKVIVAGSVHERRHPKTFEVFLAAHAEELAKHSVMLLSISLNAAFAEGQSEAVEYMTEMKMRTRLKPKAEMLVAGAVRPSSYDYYASQVIKHVLLRDQPLDPDRREYEFTDWEALKIAVNHFIQTP